MISLPLENDDKNPKSEWWWSTWRQDQPISHLQFQSSLCHPLARTVIAFKGCRYTVDMLPQPQARPPAASAVLTLVSPAGNELQLQLLYTAAAGFVCLQGLEFTFQTSPNNTTLLCVTTSPLSSLTGLLSTLQMEEVLIRIYLSKGNVLYLWCISEHVNRLKK